MKQFKIIALSVIGIVFSKLLTASASNPSTTCSVDEDKEDPDLKEFTFDIGYGTEHFLAYVQPDIKSFSRGEDDTAMRPKFNGFGVKFLNMSPQTVRLFWVSDSGEYMPMSIVRPFHSTGTASFPRHKFLFALLSEDELDDKDKTVLARFEVKTGTSLYFYDPIEVPNNKELTDINLSKLSYEQYEKYEKMVRNRKFNEKYREFTGREYLSMYPRPRPNHFMWPANFYGETHWVTSYQTHFQEIIPMDSLKKINVYGKHRELTEDKPHLFPEYRTGDEYLNMTLKVISCAPRAFEIENFLSETEVDHILKIADVEEMQLSSTADSGDLLQASKKSTTRTSFNTWVDRETDPIIDSIYRRAADVQRMDERLLRHQEDGDSSYAEALQLVHYGVGQEYTAHHDFGYAGIEDEDQPARFTTLLLYLNEGMEGGETEFPRWVNGKTRAGLRAIPKKGKAVLFYSQLPDGNMDDLSHHAANPIIKGEKFLINLWTWDPVRR